MTDNQREHSIRVVYCLSIDLIGSTEAGMKLSTRKLDLFNTSLVEQIKPHLESLELTDVLVKFTGDGWLLMTDDMDRVPALCCLSTIMANRFQDEMNRETGIAIGKIPLLKITICSGRDVRVTLPDGGIDWVGDSVRRAVRASGWCSRSHNTILIDETIRHLVFRDFATKLVDTEQLPQQPEKMEELFTVHVLGEIKPEVAADSEAPGYFVYTLDTIGKKEEAAAFAQQSEERLIDVATELSTSKKEIPQGTSRKWNRLISNISDYLTALDMLKNGQAVGFSPDVVTYNTLISKAPDYDEAKDLVDTMLQDGVLPNVVTYNTLISKATDYDAAKDWVDTMQQENIQPDVVTYNTLISKATDYDEAKTLMEMMREENIQPNVVTYSTLFGKDLSEKSADEVSLAAINEIEHQLSIFEHAANNKDHKPSFEEMIQCVLDARREDDLEERSVRADLYIQAKDGTQFFFEIKSPMPNKGQCLEVTQRLLRFHLLCGQSRPAVQAYFAMAYNPYGPMRADYRWSFALGYTPFDQAVVIGHEFWNIVGGPTAYEELLGIYQEVGHDKSKYLLDALAFGF